MTNPTIIQTPGAGEYLQQGLQQGIGAAESLQKLGLERTQVQAGIAAKQKELQLQERQVSANEAFRRGYGTYLESRGHYYQAQADKIGEQQRATQDFINGIKDPDLKFAASAAVADPRLTNMLIQQQGQRGHQSVFAGNLWIHSGGKTTWNEARAMAGLPPAEDTIGNLRAPATASMLHAAGQNKIAQLSRAQSMLQRNISGADAYRRTTLTTLQNSPDYFKRAARDPIGAAQWAEAQTDSLTAKKFPQLEQWHTQSDSLAAEAVGAVAPQLGGMFNGGNAAAVIPNPWGGGAPQQGPQGIDMNQLNALIQQQQELFDQQQDAAALNAATQQ